MFTVVPLILLVPTTVGSILFSLFCVAIAAAGAPLSAVLGILVVVWAATVAMWRVFFHTRRDLHAGTTQPMSKQWWYYLAFSAGVVLIGYAIADPGGDFWSSIALGWVAFSLAYFFALVRQSFRGAAPGA